MDAIGLLLKKLICESIIQFISNLTPTNVPSASESLPISSSMKYLYSIISFRIIKRFVLGSNKCVIWQKIAIICEPEGKKKY